MESGEQNGQGQKVREHGITDSGVVAQAARRAVMLEAAAQFPTRRVSPFTRERALRFAQMDLSDAYLTQCVSLPVDDCWAALGLYRSLLPDPLARRLTDAPLPEGDPRLLSLLSRALVLSEQVYRDLTPGSNALGADRFRRAERLLEEALALRGVLDRPLLSLVVAARLRLSTEHESVPRLFERGLAALEDAGQPVTRTLAFSFLDVQVWHGHLTPPEAYAALSAYPQVALLGEEDARAVQGMALVLAGDRYRHGTKADVGVLSEEERANASLRAYLDSMEVFPLSRAYSGAAALEPRPMFCRPLAERALDLDPDNDDARFALGLCELRGGRTLRGWRLVNEAASWGHQEARLFLNDASRTAPLRWRTLGRLGN